MVSIIAGQSVTDISCTSVSIRLLRSVSAAVNVRPSDWLKQIKHNPISFQNSGGGGGGGNSGWREQIPGAPHSV